MTTKLLALLGGLLLAITGIIGAMSLHVVPAEPVFSAVPTLDGVDSPYTTIGGFKEYRVRQSMAATSSVVCALKNPYGATSTVKALSMGITANTVMGVQKIDVSTSSSQFGSSTPAFVKNYSVGGTANPWAFDWFPATTTNLALGVWGDSAAAAGGSGASVFLLGPTEWVTFRIATGSPTASSAYMAGGCNFLIRKI